MTDDPTFGDFMLGFEGLAIVRAWGLAPQTVRERARSIVEVVEHREEPPWATPLVEREASVGEGYSEWASGYDRPDNPIVMAEEGVVREMLDARPAGAALDAACGTGRWAHYLAARGHSVTGIDTNPEMLAEARRKVPEARFELADLGAMPLAAESVDLVACTLALTHVAELAPPVSELARIVRPGGRVVISDVHPVMSTLGVHSRYPLGEGEFGFVQNHVHLTSSYLAAFREAGLSVLQCIEPLWDDAELEALGFADDVPGLLEAAVKGLPIVIVWELEKA